MKGLDFPQQWLREIYAPRCPALVSISLTKEVESCPTSSTRVGKRGMPSTWHPLCFSSQRASQSCHNVTTSGARGSEGIARNQLDSCIFAKNE